jgi:hypothetical protein
MYVQCLAAKDCRGHLVVIFELPATSNSAGGPLKQEGIMKAFSLVELSIVL